MVTYDDGATYDGEFVDGKRHGRGVYKYPDGSQYDGEFRDGERCGRGVEKYANGAQYDGEFRDPSSVAIPRFERPGSNTAKFTKYNDYNEDLNMAAVISRHSRALPEGRRI